MRALLLCLLALAVLAPAALWALAHNEAATARLLGWVPGLTVIEPRGALLGDFQARSLTLGLPRGGGVVLLDLQWRGLALAWDDAAPWHLGLRATDLQARRMDLNWVPDPVPSPTVPPADLILPVSLHIGRVQLGEAHSPLWGDAPFKALDAQVDLGAIGTHRLKLRHLAWSSWAAQGDLAVDAAAPMSVQARVKLSQASPEAQAELRLNGPLASLALAGEGRWRALAQEPAQSLSLSGELRPFAPWPLPRLGAQAAGMDLGALWPGLPRTRLDGRLTLSPAGESDLVADIDLRNTQPTAWDRGGLPLQTLKGSLRIAQALQAGSVSALLQSGEAALDAELPSLAGQPAARLGLHGGWALGATVAAAPGPGATPAPSQTLKLSLQGLVLQALDGRAPPLRLQGSLGLQPVQGAGLAGGPSAAQPPRPDAATLQARLTADIAGELSSAHTVAGVASRRPAPGASKPAPWPARPVRLTLQGLVDAGALQLDRLLLASGPQTAELSEALLRWQRPAGQAPWDARGRLLVKAFDPRVWLPWPEAAAGQTSLAGEARFALDSLGRGQVSLRVADSLLAGLPLRAQADWLALPGTAQASLKVDADAAGNRVQAQGSWPQPRQPSAPLWSPDTRGQRWQWQVQAPDLSRLQALAPWLGASRLAGEVQAEGRAQGQWPGFDTEGQLAVRRFTWTPLGGAAGGAPEALSLDEAQGSWQLDTRSLDQPASIRLRLQGGSLGRAQLKQASLVLSGTGRSHDSEVSVDLALRPAQAPGTAGSAAGGDPVALASQGVHLQFNTHGAGLSEGKGWQGQVRALHLHSGNATWLQVQPFDLGLRLTGARQRGLTAQVSPVRANVMGTDWQLQGLQAVWPELPEGSTASQAERGEFSLQADLLPLNLPQWLARWRPQGGWGGDLTVGGQLKLAHSPGRPWVVDAQFARQSGDISLSEPTIEGNSQQRLGVREARVALQARNGVWTLSEHFEGRLLGVLQGRQVVQASAPERLPAAGDALTGSMDVQIGNLRPWGVWVPAGWRLSGQLQAQATLGGTLGTPQYRGQVKGQNLGLGQALLGVNLSDGQLQLDLEGARARLTRFEARDGQRGGVLKVEGEAELAEQPRAELRLQADRFALLQRVDRRMVVSAQLLARLAQQDIALEGKVGVDEGLIDISRSDAPTIGDDVNVLNGPGQSPHADDQASAGGASARKLAANVAVDLGQKLRLRGRGIDTLLTGALRFTTPNNRPTLAGVVKTEKGTFAAYGQKLLIERGTVTFTGPIENPRLDILAMRPMSVTSSSVVSSSDVKVGVAITGTALDPRISLYSDPTLTETEKLSWLVLGRAPTGLGGADIGLLQTAAVALLSGEKASPSDNLIGMLGLDELSVRQNDSSTVRETVVNVGKQISRFWYVGYERNLNATSGSWQLIYRLGQRLTLRAQAGQDNALDLIRSWRWD
ncbi:translocation/assembly module TamB domain-containing protein [Aquabacterium sp.]|uniref:translocation/assembly module TamB domain-containing protein n=1 Tax=Aquabacterium sp. TaxID=1872578 RepID=UPI0025C58E54|nr:translocation/assembly module TamB domain-containing protein [Aquabacterium sp.]